jgi:hypothetical protein
MAQTTELAAGTTNIPREYGKLGLDWESEQEADAKSMGISVEQLRALILQKRFGIPQPAGTAPASQGDDDGESDTESPPDDEGDISDNVDGAADAIDHLRARRAGTQKQP